MLCLHVDGAGKGVIFLRERVEMEMRLTGVGGDWCNFCRLAELSTCVLCVECGWVGRRAAVVVISCVDDSHDTPRAATSNAANSSPARSRERPRPTPLTAIK